MELARTSKQSFLDEISLMCLRSSPENLGTSNSLVMDCTFEAIKTVLTTPEKEVDSEEMHLKMPAI